MNQGWSFFTDYQVWSDSLRLFARYVDHQGKSHVVKPLSFAEIERGHAYSTPTLGLSDFGTFDETPQDVKGFLQAAMDAAWEFGLRPAKFADATNELKATRYHLEDMRRIAKVPGASS